MAAQQAAGHAAGRALVLGGGGVAGIAWITGLLLGLDESGQDATRAELIVGTSAGSTVAAQLGSGVGLEELYARQVEPALQTPEIKDRLSKFGSEPMDMTLGQFGVYFKKELVINEALELARTFSTEDAVKFINGMLDAVRKKLDR